MSEMSCDVYTAGGVYIEGGIPQLSKPVKSNVTASPTKKPVGTVTPANKMSAAKVPNVSKPVKCKNGGCEKFRGGGEVEPQVREDKTTGTSGVAAAGQNTGIVTQTCCSRCSNCSNCMRTC